MSFVNIRDFVGSKSSVEEVVAFAQKYITKHAQNKGNYIFVYDNLHIGGYVNGGCYGKTGSWLGCPEDRRSDGRTIPKIVAFLDYNMKERKSYRSSLREHERFYISWIVNDSPFSTAFVEKDVDVIFNQGNVLNVKCSPKVVVGGLMALRDITDVKLIPALMHLAQPLVKAGEITNEELFIIAHYLSYGNSIQYGDNPLSNNTFYLNVGAHSTGSFATLCNFTIEGWDRFLKHEIVEKHVIADTYYLQYTPVAGAWCKDSDKKHFRQLPQDTATRLCPKTGRFLGARPYKLEEIPSLAKEFFSSKSINTSNLYTPRFHNE